MATSGPNALRERYEQLLLCVGRRVNVEREDGLLAPARVINVGAETTNLSNFSTTLSVTVELEFGNNVWYGPRYFAVSSPDISGHHNVSVHNSGTADQPPVGMPTTIASQGLRLRFRVRGTRASSHVHVIGYGIDFTLDFTDPPSNLRARIDPRGLVYVPDKMDEILIFFSSNNIIGILNNRASETFNIYPLVKFNPGHEWPTLGGLRAGPNPFQVRETMVDPTGTSSAQLAIRNSYL